MSAYDAPARRLMNQTPTIILRLFLVLAAYCLATAAAGVFVAWRGQQWYVLTFEVVVVLSALPCIGLAAKRGRPGHALGMLCLGGVVFITAALADPELVKAMIQRQTPRMQAVGGVSLMPWILSHIVVGVGLIGLSGLTVLLRRPGRSFGLLAKGIALSLPVLACGAAVVAPSVRGKIFALPAVLQIVLAIAGTAILAALVAASGHLIIRAFEIGAKNEA